MDNSAIMGDGIIQSLDEETKTIPKNFNEKETTCKTLNFDILLAFLLITIALLIAVKYLMLFDKISTKAKTLVTI